MADVDVWDVEDEQLLEAARNHLDYRSQFDTAGRNEQGSSHERIP
jgi:hypothetical protein